MSMFDDIRANKSSGLLTIIFLVNYRVGAWLLKKRRSGHRYLIVPYIPVVFVQRILQVLFGCSVPFSARLGNRVVFRHGFYGIFISGHAVVGDDVTIMHQVTIGSNFGSEGPSYAPVIGSKVFVGPGAKIIGKVRIGDNAKIGVNAVVVSDVVLSDTVVAMKAVSLGKLTHDLS